MVEDFFAPPAFDAATALIALKKQLRDQRALTERGDEFALRGKPILTLTVADNTIVARLVKQPARSPEWRSLRLASAADVRRFVDDLRGKLTGWSRDE